MDLALAHRRYAQQAGWTADLRRHLFARAGLPNAQRVLEVGAGTGAVLAGVNAAARSFGVDIDCAALQLARANAQSAALAASDAHGLPFASGSFEITSFHFVLLWLKDPAAALGEARRVTRRGGAVLAFAEPDHTQRTDAPASLAALGRLQTEALRVQGADPSIGSRLADLFAQAGLQLEQTGQLRQTEATTENESELELEVLRADLGALAAQPEAQQLLEADAKARRGGTRVVHVPTYYAFGRVP